MATTVHVGDVADLLSEGKTHFNLSPATLAEHSVRRHEAKLAANGAIVGYTNRTGRSPKDKFIVHDEMTAPSVAWGPANTPSDVWLQHSQNVSGRAAAGAESAQCLARQNRLRQSCGRPAPALRSEF